MSKSSVSVAEFMARHELLSSPEYPYDPSRPHRQPLTDAERLARIGFLVAENERLRVLNEQSAKKNVEAIAAAAVKYQEAESEAGRTISATEAVARVIKSNENGIQVPYDNRSLSF